MIIGRVLGYFSLCLMIMVLGAEGLPFFWRGTYWVIGPFWCHRIYSIWENRIGEYQRSRVCYLVAHSQFFPHFIASQLLVLRLLFCLESVFKDLSLIILVFSKKYLTLGRSLTIKQCFWDSRPFNVVF